MPLSVKAEPRLAVPPSTSRRVPPANLKANVFADWFVNASVPSFTNIVFSHKEKAAPDVVSAKRKTPAPVLVGTVLG